MGKSKSSRFFLACSLGLCTTLALSQPEAARASSSVSVMSSARMVEHSFQAMT
jgi:hypothetical protein